MAAPEGVPREAAADQRPLSVGRIAGREDPEIDTGSDHEREASGREISWPQSAEETQAAIERVLTLKYGTVVMDSDGDYAISTGAGGGIRFFVTVADGGASIAFHRTVVGRVNSQQSAVIEASYLNRDNRDVRWVLRGRALSQEMHFSTAPFVPARFGEMLDLFGKRYRGSVSVLRMRLGTDA